MPVLNVCDPVTYDTENRCEVFRLYLAPGPRRPYAALPYRRPVAWSRMEMSFGPTSGWRTTGQLAIATDTPPSMRSLFVRGELQLTWYSPSGSNSALASASGESVAVPDVPRH